MPSSSMQSRRPKIFEATAHTALSSTLSACLPSYDTFCKWGPIFAVGVFSSLLNRATTSYSAGSKVDRFHNLSTCQSKHVRVCSWWYASQPQRLSKQRAGLLAIDFVFEVGAVVHEGVCVNRINESSWRQPAHGTVRMLLHPRYKLHGGHHAPERGELVGCGKREQFADMVVPALLVVVVILLLRCLLIVRNIHLTTWFVPHPSELLCEQRTLLAYLSRGGVTHPRKRLCRIRQVGLQPAFSTPGAPERRALLG